MVQTDNVGAENSVFDDYSEMVETNNSGADQPVFDNESTVTQRSHAARRLSADVPKNGSIKTESKSFYNSVSQTIQICKSDFW